MDANIFERLGTACIALQRAGFRDRASELRERLLVKNEAKTYDDAVRIIHEYVSNA